MFQVPSWLTFGSEVVKVVGGFASFYAVYKLRKIEQRYLFKATMPELVKSIRRSLDSLNVNMVHVNRNQAEIVHALNVLAVDVTNISRKARGDTMAAANELLALIRPRRYFFWRSHQPMDIQKARLIEIYGKGNGLLRSIQNDVSDQDWSAK